MSLKSEGFSLEDLKLIDFKKISAAAEEKAMSDMRLASYYDSPENFSVIIDYSVAPVVNPDLKQYPPETPEYLENCTIIVSADSWVDEDQFPDPDEAESELKEAIIDYCIDNYITPAEEHEFSSRGIDRAEFFEWFREIAPQEIGYKVAPHYDVDLRPWEE